MVDVPQPSSLTLELNPFEQSFASKASNETSPKPVNGAPSAAETPGQPTAGDYHQPAYHSTQSQNHAVKNETGFVKTATALPMPPNGPSPFPSVAGSANIPNPAQWMSNQMGPFTPTIPGIPPNYENFRAPGMRPNLPHQPLSNHGQPHGQPNGQPLHTPTSMVMSSQIPNAAPTSGYPPPFPNMPLESPGIFMPVPMHPKYQFPVMAPSSQHPNSHLNSSHSPMNQSQSNLMPNLTPRLPTASSPDGSTPGLATPAAPALTTAASHAAANSLYMLNQDGHHPDAKRAPSRSSAPHEAESVRKRARSLANNELPRSQDSRMNSVPRQPSPVPDLPKPESLGASSPTASDSGQDLKRLPRDVSEEDRRKQFLERNRIAAVKCRQRKKQWVDELKAKVDSFSRANEDLRSKNLKLENDLAQLVHFVRHAHPLETLPSHIASVLNYHQHSLEVGVDPNAASIPGSRGH